MYLKIPGLNVEHFFQVVFAMAFGELNTLLQISFVFFVQIISEIEKDL